MTRSIIAHCNRFLILHSLASDNLSQQHLTPFPPFILQGQRPYDDFFILIILPFSPLI